MSNLLAGFSGELLKLAASDASPIPLILTKKPKEADLEGALKKVEHDSHHDQGWKKIHPSPGPVKRNYLASMLIGAAAAPAMGMVGKGFGRALRNRSLRRAAEGISDAGRKAELLGKVERGPLIARFNPDTPATHKPVVDTAELGGRAAQGMITGSIIQALRDHFSGGHH